MPGWLVAGSLSVAAGALSVLVWHRSQQRRQTARLARAIEEGDLDEARLLLAEGGCLPAFRKWRGEPALIAAARSGCGVELALARGADPDERGPGWMTALMHAAALGDEDQCRALLAAGADPDACDLFGRPVAWWAGEGRRPGIVRLLREAGGRAVS